MGEIGRQGEKVQREVRGERGERGEHGEWLYTSGLEPHNHSGAPRLGGRGLSLSVNVEIFKLELVSGEEALRL